jgi:hypothetical protein
LVNGIATLNTSALGLGLHSITASYGGSIDFAAFGSSALTVTVLDFILSPTTSSATTLPDSTSVFTFSISPVGGATFPDAIALSLQGLPTEFTYNFSPVTTPAGVGTESVTLSVNVPQHLAIVRSNKKLGESMAPLSLALFLLPFVGRLRRASNRFSRNISVLLLLLASMVATVGISGCGNSMFVSGGFLGQTQKTYTLTVAGTSGSLSHSANVTLSVK